MKLRDRLSRRTGQDTSGPVPAVPWWVSVFTDFGRPLAAVVVLVLCAPGEQHLAELSGWRGWLSWGMAGLFSMYAGIAAVVATVRPKGAPGKQSAVWGAVLSLLLAMGAQPVSHLFVTGWLSAEPRAPWPLIVTVSCVPPFILGHLLHLASSPVRPVVPVRDTEAVPVLSWDGTDTLGPVVPATPEQRDKVVRTVSRASGVPQDMLGPVVPSRPVPVPDKPVSLLKRDKAVPDELGQKRDLTQLVRDLRDEGLDEDTIKSRVRDRVPDVNPDSLRKAVRRTRTA